MMMMTPTKLLAHSLLYRPIERDHCRPIQDTYTVYLACPPSRKRPRYTTVLHGVASFTAARYTMIDDLCFQSRRAQTRES